MVSLFQKLKILRTRTGRTPRPPRPIKPMRVTGKYTGGITSIKKAIQSFSHKRKSLYD